MLWKNFQRASASLSVGDIEDVADDSADRRADGVQYAKRLIGRGRHASEPAFVDQDGIAGAEQGGGRHDEADGAAGVRVRDGDAVASGAR